MQATAKRSVSNHPDEQDCCFSEAKNASANFCGRRMNWQEWLDYKFTQPRIGPKDGAMLHFGKIAGKRKLKDKIKEMSAFGLDFDSGVTFDEMVAKVRELGCAAVMYTTSSHLRLDELLVLCASRSGEARLARWSEIDLDAAEWTIPAERMKAKRDHRIPLSERAVEILREAEALADDSGLVFPGTKSGKPLSDATLSKLVRELGFDVDVHGFRTSFKTWCQEQTNTPGEVSEAALAHTVRNKAEAAYARSDLFEKRRKLMEKWASYLALPRNGSASVAYL